MDQVGWEDILQDLIRCLDCPNISNTFLTFSPKDIVFVRDTKLHDLEPVSLYEYFRSFPVSNVPVPSKDAKQWTFISTNAQYDLSHEHNHWVPAITTRDVPRKLFDALSWFSDSQLEVKVLELQEAMMTAADDAQAAEAENQFFAAKAHQDFRARCMGCGFHPIHVPADGNCLIWSIKCLLEGDFEGNELDTSDRNALAMVQEIRRELSNAWMEFKPYPMWQLLFQLVEGLESDSEMEEEPAADTTPKRKGKGYVPDTTPKDKKSFEKAPDKDKKVKKVDAGAVAPAWKRHCPTLVSLEVPPAVKVKEECGIPEVPEDEQPGQVVNSKRRRTTKKKNKTATEQKLSVARSYLSNLGLAYGVWQSWHWQHHLSARTGICKDGKWMDLVNRMLVSSEEEKAESWKSCMVCKELLETYHFSAVDLRRHMNEDRDDRDGMQNDDQQGESAAQDARGGMESSALVLVLPKDEEHNEERDEDDVTEMDMETLARSVSPYYQDRYKRNETMNFKGVGHPQFIEQKRSNPEHLETSKAFERWLNLFDI